MSNLGHDTLAPAHAEHGLAAISFGFDEAGTLVMMLFAAGRQNRGQHDRLLAFGKAVPFHASIMTCLTVGRLLRVLLCRQ